MAFETFLFHQYIGCILCKFTFIMIYNGWKTRGIPKTAAQCQAITAALTLDTQAEASKTLHIFWQDKTWTGSFYEDLLVCINQTRHEDVL